MAWTIRQMDGFAGWPYGDDSALVVFHASIRCSVWGRSGPHAGRLDVHVAPAVGATSFGPRPVANRAHRRSNLGRSARGRSRGAITRLDVGMGIRGACQIISERFCIDGGRLRGRVRDRLAMSRRVLLLWCIAEAVPFPGIGGRSTSLLKAKGIE